MATENKLPIKYTSLIPDQSAFKDVLDVGPLPVDVVITVTSAGKIPDEVMKKHFRPKADAVIQDYETTISEELKRLAAKIGAAQKNGAADDAKAMIGETTMSVTNALANLQRAINSEIDAVAKKEGQRDANLKEARVATAAKAGKITISLAKGVATAVASGGVNLKAYYDIASALYDAYSEICQQLKDGDALSRDFAKELAEVKAAADAAKKKKALAEAEEKRRKYRNHTTKYLRAMKSAGENADKLAAAMKEAKTLKSGVEIGAKAMAAKRQVTALQAKYDAGDKKLEEMGALLTQLGGKPDDQTTF